MNKSLLLTVVFALFSVSSLVYFAPANPQEMTSEKAGAIIGTSLSNGPSSLLRDMVQSPVKSSKSGPKVIARPNGASDSDARGILISGVRVSDNTGEEGETQTVKVEGTGFQIFDKGTDNSILGPSDISTIWAGSGGACETGGTGNAVVLYDKDAGRWIFSQFASTTGNDLASEECFAVSTTGDATGSYYRYAFHLGGRFVDSPHLSVRSDGYLMGDSVYDESSIQRIGNQFFIFDRKAMLDGSEASFKSPGIDTGTGETYSISADGVRISSTPTRTAVSTLTINLTFDTDATFTTAGLSAQNIIDMKAASAFAATQLTSNFKDPVNVNIKVTSVADPSVLGQSNSSLTSPVSSFTTIRDKTFADKTTADDITATAAAGSLASTLTDPIGGTHNFWVTTAQSKALAISADNAVTLDGTYTFGGGHSYTYDPNNRAVAGKIDYIGVSLHEFTEIMGRIGLLGSPLGQGGNPGYMQMDLFHYTGAAARGLTNGAGRSFSFNNGTSLLKAFNNEAANGGDSQDWATGTNDAFNAFSTSGVKNDMSAVDLQVMDVIGYDFGVSAPVSTMTANVGTTPQTAAIITVFANALGVTVRDGTNNPIPGVNVTFTAPGAGASGTFSNAATTITIPTNASGIAAAPFTANSTIGGPYTVTAAASGFTTINFSLTNTVGAATSMTANAGTTPQSVAINAAFANAPAVTVRDVGANPVSGVNVTFTAPAAGASGKFSNNTTTITVPTNASGIASAPFTANTTTGGPYIVTAAANGLTTVNFSLTNITGAASSMSVNAGTTPQSTTVNTAFPNPLAVTIRDAGSNPVSGVSVTFIAPAAGQSGTFSNATTTITLTTNASGIASVPFTANGTAGGPYSVLAASTGLTTVNFSLTNIGISPPSAVAVSPNITTAGATTTTITTTYTDNTGINVSTLGGANHDISGPNAFAATAVFVSVNINSNGTPRVATYTLFAPGGTWDATDNGTYTISMRANQVADIDGNFVPSGVIGTFTVNIPAATPTPPATTFEGDVNRTVLGVPGFGDGDVNVGDQIQYQRFLSGTDCPGGTPNEQQRLDAGPRNFLGDGLLGSSDGTAIDAYARHDPATDFNPNVAGWQPTPAGGPTAITNLGCTPISGPESDVATASVPEPELASAARVVRVVSRSGARNSDITVDIEMAAQGNEAGTQYGLHFDPTVLSISSISGVNTNPDIMLGAGAPSGTTLNVNAADAAAGNIGIVENFNGNAASITAIPAGATRIARVRFHILDGAGAGSSRITFDESAIRGVTSDANGMILSATYEGGDVSVTSSRGVTISGRVTSSDGRGIRGATVTIVGEDGLARTATTSSFGYYNFEDVAAATYTIGVSSRQYRFGSRTITVGDNLANVDFTGWE